MAINLKFHLFCPSILTTYPDELKQLISSNCDRFISSPASPCGSSQCSLLQRVLEVRLMVWMSWIFTVPLAGLLRVIAFHWKLLTLICCLWQIWSPDCSPSLAYIGLPSLLMHNKNQGMLYTDGCKILLMLYTQYTPKYITLIIPTRCSGDIVNICFFSALKVVL